MLELLDLQKPLLNTRTMRLLIFILAFSATSLFAGQPDSLKTKKWAVGITYSPDYCFRVPYSGKTEAFATNTEKAKIGFTTGLNLLYRLMDKIGIELGVLYSTKGQKVNTPAWTNPGSSYYDPAIPVYYDGANQPEKKITYTYKYLEIPLKVNIYIINKKFKVFPSIGCSANIFTGKTTKISSSDGNETSHVFDAKNIPSTEFALLVGVGLSYDINKKIFVKLEPSYRTFIRPLVDGPVSGTLYSVGANAGVYFNF